MLCKSKADTAGKVECRRVRGHGSHNREQVMKLKTNTLLAVCATVVAIVNLPGCEIGRNQVGYRYEHGDRIAPDGRRDVGWCIAHSSNEHCRSAVADSQ
jgi:hypothetical protein